MKGQTPDWRVTTVASDPETGKERWTNVGVAFENNQTITVLMDAVPVNGKLVLMRPKQNQQA
ncbi:MAG: hypothetical protein GF334_08375 [Candidatus Altiarchaeales archaeon]|nr:hypothetical protein [Candidatus Altiarchaeales archaeon]